MLEISNERGEVMELDPDMSIPTERNNPLFNEVDKFFQDITQSGKAPMSPNNKAFFNYGHLVDVSNSLYEFPVTVKVNGFPQFSGFCKFKVASGYYEFTLKVNFGALAQQFKSVKLNQIKTYDYYRPSIITTTGWEAYMKDTCENAADFPYAFFPVFNDGVEYKGELVSTTTNLWDYAAQSFRIRPPGEYLIALDYMMFNTPYFKLTYILKKVIEAMGFKATGNFFNAENDTIYLWNQNNVTQWNPPYGHSSIYLSIQHSMFYAPDVSIYDFLGILREDPRLKLTFNFDLFNETVQVDSFYDILSDPESTDIAAYVEEVTEVEVKLDSGFSITLAPDSLDDLFLQNGDHAAFEKLIIGDGSKELEVNANTLMQHDADTVACKRQVAVRRSSGIGPGDPLPLRLIRFTGMRLIEPGKYIPHSEPMPLSTEHAEFYEFKVNAKKVQLKASLPPDVLQLNTSKKISFYYNGVNQSALIERMRYDLASKSRIAVKIEAYSLHNQIENTSRIEPITVADTETVDSNTTDLICAYFNTEATGITSIKPVCLKSGFTLVTQEIKVSTSNTGIGGQNGFVVKSSGTGYPESYELRIFEAEPQYAERMGVRYEFSTGPGYWYTTINETLFNYSSSSLLKGFFGPLWIVF